MSYTPPSQEDLLQLAIAVAKVAHSGQTRHGGEDYFTDHIVWVAEKVRAERGLTAATIAYLHDTLEDTTVTQHSLLSIGVPARVVHDVVMLTRGLDESYGQFIDRLIEYGSDEALYVKLADIEHNTPGATDTKRRLYLASQGRLMAELDRRNAAREFASSHKLEEALVA